MRKFRGYSILRFFVYSVTLLVSFMVILFVTDYIKDSINLYYVSKELNSDFDPDSVTETFRGHFSPEMTRQEVSDILLKIDPSLQEQLQQQHISCDRYGCFEVLCLFHERANCQVTYYFIYSSDLRLKYITYD